MIVVSVTDGFLLSGKTINVRNYQSKMCVRFVSLQVLACLLRARRATGESRHSLARDFDTTLNAIQHYTKDIRVGPPAGMRSGAHTMPDSVRRGEHASGAKLTEQQVHEMRRLYGEGWPSQRLAETFKLAFSTVRRVVLRRTWTHI